MRPNGERSREKVLLLIAIKARKKKSQVTMTANRTETYMRVFGFIIQRYEFIKSISKLSFYYIPAIRTL